MVTSLGKQFGTFRTAVGLFLGVFAQIKGVGLLSYGRDGLTSGIPKLASQLVGGIKSALSKHSLGDALMDSFYDSHKSLKISDLLANNQIQLSDQVKDWYEGLNEARQSAVTLGDAMRAVGTSTLTAGTAFSKLKSIVVSVLSSLASAGLAIAASFAIGALINTITN